MRLTILYRPRLVHDAVILDRDRVLFFFHSPLGFCLILVVQQICLRLIGRAADRSIDRIVQLQIIASLGQPLRVLQQLMRLMPVSQVVLLLLLEAVMTWHLVEEAVSMILYEGRNNSVRRLVVLSDDHVLALMACLVAVLARYVRALV